MQDIEQERRANHELRNDWLVIWLKKSWMSKSDLASFRPCRVIYFSRLEKAWPKTAYTSRCHSMLSKAQLDSVKREMHTENSQAESVIIDVLAGPNIHDDSKRRNGRTVKIANLVGKSHASLSMNLKIKVQRCLDMVNVNFCLVLYERKAESIELDPLWRVVLDLAEDYNNDDFVVVNNLWVVANRKQALRGEYNLSIVQVHLYSQNRTSIQLCSCILFVVSKLASIRIQKGKKKNENISPNLKSQNCNSSLVKRIVVIVVMISCLIVNRSHPGLSNTAFPRRPKGSPKRHSPSSTPQHNPSYHAPCASTPPSSSSSHLQRSRGVGVVGGQAASVKPCPHLARWHFPT